MQKMHVNYYFQYQDSPELEALGHLICRRLKGAGQKLGIHRPDLHHKPIPTVFTPGTGYMFWLSGSPHVTEIEGLDAYRVPHC